MLSLNFSQKETDEFVFLPWWLRNTRNLKSKFKFQVFPSRQDRKTNSFIRFWEKFRLDNFCFEIYWPLLKYVSIQVEIHYLLTVLLPIPLNKLPCQSSRSRYDSCPHSYFWWWHLRNHLATIQFDWYLLSCQRGLISHPHRWYLFEEMNNFCMWYHNLKLSYI